MKEVEANEATENDMEASSTQGVELHPIDRLASTAKTGEERELLEMSLEFAVRMRPNNDKLASIYQIKTLLSYGMTFAEAIQLSKDEAKSIIYEFKRDSGALRTRWEAFQARKAKAGGELHRCGCPHCLGHIDVEANAIKAARELRP